MRLTGKIHSDNLHKRLEGYRKEMKRTDISASMNAAFEDMSRVSPHKLVYEKLGQLEDIEDELGIDLITFLKGIDTDTCFMQITKDKRFDFCGDAYYGYYTKEGLLKLIQELLFMYWALTKEELE